MFNPGLVHGTGKDRVGEVFRLSPRVAHSTGGAVFNPVVSIYERIVRALLPAKHYKRIGSGNGRNGMTFAVWGPWATLLDQWRMRGSNFVQRAGPVPTHAAEPRIAVKVRFLLDQEHEWLSMSEDECHKRVDATVHACGRPACPKFYCGATLAFRDFGTVRVTAMELLENCEPLSCTLADGAPLSMELAAGIEASVTKMWVAGVAHCDLHEGNILVRRSEGRNTAHYIIDFGHSVLLTESESVAVRQALMSGRDPVEAFDEVLLPTLGALQRSRRLDYFHADSRCIAMIRASCKPHRETDGNLSGNNATKRQAKCTQRKEGNGKGAAGHEGPSDMH
jgi:hypothetical protein